MGREGRNEAPRWPDAQQSWHRPGLTALEREGRQCRRRDDTCFAPKQVNGVLARWCVHCGEHFEKHLRRTAPRPASAACEPCGDQGTAATALSQSERERLQMLCPNTHEPRSSCTCRPCRDIRERRAATKGWQWVPDAAAAAAGDRCVGFTPKQQHGELSRWCSYCGKHFQAHQQPLPSSQTKEHGTVCYNSYAARVGAYPKE